MAWLGQLFVSLCLWLGGLACLALCLPTWFHCLGWWQEMVWLGHWMLSRGLARSAVCCPTCFIWLLLGWMLSRDGLARSALYPHSFLSVFPLFSSRACLAGCCHERSGSVSSLSPHLFPFVSPLVSMLSRDGLARSGFCFFTCFLTRLLGRMPTCFLARLGRQRFLQKYRSASLLTLVGCDDGVMLNCTVFCFARSVRQCNIVFMFWV